MGAPGEHEGTEGTTRALLAFLTGELSLRLEAASAITEFARVVLAGDHMVAELAGGPEHVLRAEDVLSQAALRGAAMRNVLEQEMVSAEDAGWLLGSDASTNRRQYANKHRESGVLLGVRMRNKYLYPVFQFDSARRALHPVAGRVNALLDARGDPWGVASWWITPRESLDGRCPADLIGTADEDRAEDLARSELEPLG